MSWLAKRTVEYKNGARMTWFERAVFAHADPFNALLLAIGGVAAAYGFWQHDWNLVIGGGVIALIGDLISWLRK